MSPLLSTLGAASVRGFRNLNYIESGPLPEYWWRADYGVSTASWLAYRGGLDFTLYNTTSANSTTGIYLNGSNGYGQTQNLSSNLLAKHIMVRTDFISGSGTMLGGTQSNTHEWLYQFNFIVQSTTKDDWGASGGSVGTKATWSDFSNFSNTKMFLDSDTIGYDKSTYIGVFLNYFQWSSGNSIYLGRRQLGDYGNFYIKELAIFTTALTVEQGIRFRNGMLARWP